MPLRSTSGSAARRRSAKYAALILLACLHLFYIVILFSSYSVRRDLEVESLKLGGDQSLDYLMVLSNTGVETVRKVRDYRCLERDAIAFYRLASMDVRQSLSMIYGQTLPLRAEARRFVEEHAVLDATLTKGRFDDAWGIPLASDLVFQPGTSMELQQATVRDFNGVIEKQVQQFKASLKPQDPAYKLLISSQDKVSDASSLRALARDRQIQERAMFDFTAIDALETALTKMNADMKAAGLTDSKRLNILLRKLAADDALASRSGETSFLSELAGQLDVTGQGGEALRDLDCGKLDGKLAAQIIDSVAQRRPGLDSVQQGLIRAYFEERSQPPASVSILRRTADFVREDVHGAAIRNFIAFPTSAQTCIVTMLFGSLGALSLQALRLSNRGYWGTVSDPSWGEIGIAMWLGMAAAIIVYLLASIGLVVVSEGRSSAGEVSTVGASLVALLGFVSGLLNDEAFGRIRRFGLQFFENGAAATQEAETTGPNAELVQRLLDAGCARFAELARAHCLGTTLAPKDHFTLFVPADASFDARPLSEWRELADPKLAVPFTGFVNHRLVDESTLTAEDLLARTELTMADGSVMPIDKTGGDIRLDGEHLETAQPYTWRNGIIYVTRP